MFSMLKRQRFALLSTLLVVGFASLSLSGASAVNGAEGDEGVCGAATPAQSMTVASGEHSVAACSATCTGFCRRCILGVCENTCS
jgi:hypothetical protein